MKLNDLIVRTLPSIHIYYMVRHRLYGLPKEKFPFFRTHSLLFSWSFSLRRVQDWILSRHFVCNPQTRIIPVSHALSTLVYQNEDPRTDFVIWQVNIRISPYYNDNLQQSLFFQGNYFNSNYYGGYKSSVNVSSSCLQQNTFPN